MQGIVELTIFRTSAPPPCDESVGGHGGCRGACPVRQLGPVRNLIADLEREVVRRSLYQTGYGEDLAAAGRLWRRLPAAFQGLVPVGWSDSRRGIAYVIIACGTLTAVISRSCPAQLNRTVTYARCAKIGHGIRSGRIGCCTAIVTTAMSQSQAHE